MFLLTVPSTKKQKAETDESKRVKSFCFCIIFVYEKWKIDCGRIYNYLSVQVRDQSLNPGKTDKQQYSIWNMEKMQSFSENPETIFFTKINLSIFPAMFKYFPSISIFPVG